MEGMIIDGRYDIGKKIGCGGHGEVYEGVERDGGRKIAAKFEDEEHGDLLTEYKAYTLLHGTAGIPEVYHYENIGRYNVLIMEVMGSTMAHILDEQKPIPYAQAISFAKQLLETLQQIHAKGIVHFDLKLSNIMTGAETKRDVSYIVDFGSAHLYSNVELENNKTLQWFQERDKYNLHGIILDLLQGTRHDTKKMSSSI